MILMTLAGAAVVIVTVTVMGMCSDLKRSKFNSMREQRNIATKALRQIANGSGSPQLEAQIALDEIESKEITR